jgi:HEAT repeat protein
MVRWMQYEPEPWRRVALIVIPGVELLDRRRQLASASVGGFRVLGPQAAPAVPSLVPLLKSTNVNVAGRALAAAEAAGNDGIRLVLDVLTNNRAYNPDLRLYGSMRSIGTNAGMVVPVLKQCLKGSDSEGAGTAAVLLGNIAEEPGNGSVDDIVAALGGATESPDQQVRYCAVYELGKLKDFARPTVPALVRALGDTDEMVRKAATNSLRKVAPETLEEKRNR